MPRANEFTPLLVGDEDAFRPSRRPRRSVWQFVLAGALSLGVLSLFRQQRSPLGLPLDVVSLDEGEEAAFFSSMETYKDLSVDPCVDFYQYACGGWLRRYEIPSDRPSIDASFYVVSETNKDTIQKIFDQKPPQIHELYQSCLNSQEVDTDAVAFVAGLIENVHQATSTLALMEYAGEMDQSLGISSFFSLFVGADPQDPSTNVLQLAQGGLTLPSREYYLEESKVDAYAALFVDYVTKLFAVADLDKHNVTEYAQAVLETETSFSKISLPNAALRNPWTTSKAYPFAEIAQRYPFLMAYLNGIYKQEPFPMLHAIVATPDFFEAQNELLSDESLLPQLKNYLSFHLIDSFGAILGEYFRRASHEFHGRIQGAGSLMPRDQFCVRLTTAYLGDELGEYYMKEVFGPDAKAAAQALVTEIEESLKALLTTEAWLDKVTYEAAVAKLDKVKNYIGGPDIVEPLPFALQADAFFNNVKSLMQLSAAGTIQAINEPVNEQAWDMFPSTVNAYYDPSANKMVFPAAILQPPFYSAKHFPAAANFARIGMVMGHELSHGFDDQGRNYDGNGALRSWWTPSVSAEFAEKAQCLSAQYSTFPVVSIEDEHVLGTVNGNLTLGENIADNGGIHLAYEAYQLWKSTFAPSPAVPPAEVPPATPSPPAESPAGQTPEPAESIPASVPVETAPTPEPTETIPATVSPPEVQTPGPSAPNPNEGIPAVTPAPIVPIPDEPVPEPTETGPGEQIPVVTLPPPVLPVPEAETPEPAQTGPSGEIPIAPQVVPEPQPTGIGPGEVIPEGTSPAPEEQPPAPTEAEPPTEIPVATPPPPPAEPTPEQQTPAPSEPLPEETAPPAVSTHEPSTSSPSVETKPIEVTPSPVATEASPEKHKHKKDKEEPEEEEPSGKLEHHKGESDKDKMSDKSKPKDEESHKHSSKKHGEKEEKKSHGDEKLGGEDGGAKSSKHSNQHGKDEEDEKHRRHDDDYESKGDDKKHHEGKSEGHREKDEHGHDNDDGDLDESGEKHYHEKGEESDRDSHVHRESKRERHRRDEEKEGEKSDRYGKYDHSDEEENGRHKHSKHESKEERREERKEHRKEEDGIHEHGDHERKEERREERKERRKEEEERKEERREERKERREEKEERKEERREERNERRKEEEEDGHHEKSKHHHRSDEEYDEDRESGHHEEHRRHHEECDDCEREEHERHIRHHRCGKDESGCGPKHHKWALSENVYPFSGGDARIHNMVERLARAMVQTDDPAADDRLFFTAFAQNWCEKRTPGYAELLRMIDPHSPGKWRVNGPLMNYGKFAEAFSCPVGTPMNPEKKCIIW